MAKTSAENERICERGTNSKNKGEKMNLINFWVDCMKQSAVSGVIIVVILWLGIGYINSYFVRFVPKYPCRPDGNVDELTFFKVILFSGPFGVFLTMFISIDEFVIVPYLRRKNLKGATLS